MEPGAGFSLFSGAWRHPAMNMGMDLSQVSQAAYRYNQNMMEYYTCKAVIGAHQGHHYADGDNNSDFFLSYIVSVV